MTEHFDKLSAAEKRALKVFLCHAHSDKDVVKALYARLKREGVDVWLDKEKLLPGADWELEIRKAVREADVVVVCLSKQFNHAGFRQKEVRIALDAAMEKPEGEIFIIPARLEECDTLESLRKWHWVDLFESDGFQRLILALRVRADKIGATLRQRGRATISRPKIKDEQEATHAKAKLEAEELEKQKAAKERADREVAEKTAREKAEKEAAEKTRLEAEEIERRRLAKEQTNREAAEKAAREKTEKEAAEKARLEAEEVERRRLAKEQADREAADKIAREKARLEAEEAERRRLAKEQADRETADVARIAREKAEKETTEKAHLEAEELERQRFAKAAREKAEREAVKKARLEAEELARRKTTKEKSEREEIETKPEIQKPQDNSSAMLWVVGGILVIVLVVWLSSLNGMPSTPAPTSNTFTSTPETVILPSQTLLPTKISTPTAYVGSLPIEITDDKGVLMRLVPAGEFTMGSENDRSNEKPVHQVYLDAFYMDKYEVTNVLYKACEEAGGCAPPQGTYTYNDQNYENHPVVSMNWSQAKTYCEWRDGSLPTEAQWEKAARSTDERTFPWGEGIDCDKANYYGCKKDTTLVGSYESGKSPYGIYDLAGSVWEWTADWYSETYYQNSPSENPLGPDSGQDRVLRGGAWNIYENALRTSNRNWRTPNDWGYDIGFRCVRSLP